MKKQIINQLLFMPWPSGINYLYQLGFDTIPRILGIKEKGEKKEFYGLPNVTIQRKKNWFCMPESKKKKERGEGI